ncbi:GntR family transcriptional regulator [Curtobacterium sp. NPDC090217]|uniref:GntR family transcriptional regulator n=1 Tax=Curtobacterium sp. NPDC090217 TaxID=3363970 RepID=UPI0038154E91
MTTADVLRGPLPAHAGVPLRVAAYMRISDAIRGGAIQPGILLPSEAELVELLGVSRTVVREALIFLEEDGFIRSRRGIGRFVAERLPVAGLERVEAPERLLVPEGGDVERTEMVVQDRTGLFAAESLGIAESSPSWFVESVVRRGDTVVGLVQEHLPPDDALVGEYAPVRELIRMSRPDQTMLAAMFDAGIVPGPGTTEVSIGTPGETRGHRLGVSAEEPVLVLTRSLRFAGRPLYVSKTLVNPREARITVTHGAP